MTIKGLFAFDVPQGSRLPSPTRWGAGGANLCSTQKRLFLSCFPDPHSSPSLRASHSCVLMSTHWISHLLYSNKPQCSLMNGIWETKGFPQKQPTNQPQRVSQIPKLLPFIPTCVQAGLHLPQFLMFCHCNDVVSERTPKPCGMARERLPAAPLHTQLHL